MIFSILLVVLTNVGYMMKMYITMQVVQVIEMWRVIVGHAT